ncbi:hypothetical protein DVK02_05320 [Halobellus sp. Atlit-31R]|nr:hypothetical protein DVK02_05320 [Halobellus sp. Atlit-31R]
MRRRGTDNRLKLWLLLEANRWVVAAVVLLGILCGIVLMASAVTDRVVLSVGDPVETLFQGLLTATITGVTLVVSINSLVLSQELGTLGDQRERMEGAMAFRRDVEDELGVAVAPATPAAFLRALVDAVERRSVRLSEATDAVASERVGTGRVQRFAEDVREHATAVSDDLADPQFGTFDVLSAALNFNYSWKIHEARRLRDELAEVDDSTESVRELRDAVDGLVSVLTLFGPAREHFKTLYFQWELVDLSRAMLYSAVPALLVATNTLLFHGVLGSFSGATLGVADYVWIVALATAITLAPFAILLSFVLRIGTIAKRTLSIGPFILRATGGNDADDRHGG